MNRNLLIRIVIIALSAVLIAVGLYTGEHKEVYRKGTQVCLSCMGIG